jgi:putative ABC transport system permease protein
MRQYLMSTLLAAFSIAVGTALLITVYNLRVQTEENFKQTGLGIDAVLAPKGSELQMVLASIYNLEDMPGTVKWSYVSKFENNGAVDLVIPFIKGHSYGGVHVNAIDDRFFTKFEYVSGKKFSFAVPEGGAGRMFEKKFEAVAGSEAARLIGLKVGSKFNPT